MGKGSKRRTGENTAKIVSNWDNINWKDSKKLDKKKNERKRINNDDR
jgi:hypothetical protein